jgi:hypothetical protein
MGIATLVPSGTFWSPIATITNRASPSVSEAYAVPIAKPSGRLCTSSTPNTRSDRRTPAPRSLADVHVSPREEAARDEEESSAHARAGGDAGSAVLRDRREQQPDNRRHGHQADRRAPEERPQAVGVLAHEEHRHGASAGRERRGTPSQREQADLH